MCIYMYIHVMCKDENFPLKAVVFLIRDLKKTNIRRGQIRSTETCNTREACWFLMMFYSFLVINLVILS